MQLNLIWLIYRQGSQLAKDAALNCLKPLKDIGASVELILSNSSELNLAGTLSSGSQVPDLAVVFGGDGTVLGAARYLALYRVPILSFNVGGQLGFLTHDSKLLSDKNLWKRLLEDSFEIERRMMLQSCVQTSSVSEEYSRQSRHKDDHYDIALNDFYIRPYGEEESSPICTLELQIDGEVVDHYKGDGLILATSTGSTAYAMATGGPILHPGIEAIVVSPICPMSLSSRHLVVPPGSRMTIKLLGESANKVKLWKDGTISDTMVPGDYCFVQRSRYYASMLLLEKSHSYYRSLTRKLNWAGSFVK